MDTERAGGMRHSGSWHGRDAALAVVFGARSERCPSARWEETNDGPGGQVALG
jgi:hypothetical protein